VQTLANDENARVVMTVQPGESGRPFEPDNLEIVREIRRKQPNCRIVIDGGINLQNLAKVIKSGADTVVMGMTIYELSTRRQRRLRVMSILETLRKLA